MNLWAALAMMPIGIVVTVLADKAGFHSWKRYGLVFLVLLLILPVRIVDALEYGVL